LDGILSAIRHPENKVDSLNGTLRSNPTKEERINNMKKTIMLIAVLGGLGLAAVANANSLTLVNDSPPVTGTYNWNYHVDWSNSTLNTGDFVTITGVTGVDSVTGPAGWTGSFTATTVKWTWTGGTTPLGSGTGTISGFTYHSVNGGDTAAAYNTQDHVNSGLGKGKVSTVTGFVSAAAAVPDGGSAVTLLGIALAGIEGARRMLRTRKA
jgi:hypothetical protein